MPKAVSDDPRFRNEAAAYDWVEAKLWANGRSCPHCGVIDKSGPLNGKSTRIGVYKCYACRKPFTVKLGTIFESSHVPMHLWLQAIQLVCCGRKGIGASRLRRVLGVDLKTARFIERRIGSSLDEGAPGLAVGHRSPVVDRSWQARLDRARPDGYRSETRI
jgi:transposase-like protein